MPPLVTLVALPIGNTEDLSLRSTEALKSADRIFCEDTRKTRELLRRAGIESHAFCMALPGDSEKSFDWEALAREHPHEKSWVLVSDAGTPLVNDPGAFLLEFCRRHSWEVRALPGPCAPILAWQWSGGFGLPFVFAGFAPKAKSIGTQDLEKFFSAIKRAGTFVYFDTRHQFQLTLAHLKEAGHGERSLYVAREMTKGHEELIAGSVDSCLEVLKQRLQQTDALGEMTFVLRGDGQSESSGAALTLEDFKVIRGGSPKEAARRVAESLGCSVRDVYQFFLSDHQGVKKKS